MESFRRQFVQLFVGRGELLLNPTNEFGLRVRVLLCSISCANKLAVLLCWNELCAYVPCYRDYCHDLTTSSTTRMVSPSAPHDHRAVDKHRRMRKLKWHLSFPSHIVTFFEEFCDLIYIQYPNKFATEKRNGGTSF